METIRFGNQSVVGFGLGDSAPSTSIGKYGAFMVGAGLTGLAGIVASGFFGEGISPDDRMLNSAPILLISALGGGIAGAIVAPSRSGY